MSLIVHSQRHSLALARLASTSKRAAVDIVKQEFGLMLTEVAKYTPPAGNGVIGKKAEAQGRAAVAADIYATYGTPSDAYEAVAKKQPAAASAFWFLHQGGQRGDAAEIVRSATGKSFSGFDGGTGHRRQRIGVRRRRRENPLYFVDNPEALEAYVREQQGDVWTLASGWAPALQALGRRLPYGVGKQNAPGSLRVKINDAKIEIVAIDGLPWASQVAGIERRILWAMSRRADALDRRWENFIRNVKL
jgi:hypothetical protein